MKNTTYKGFTLVNVGISWYLGPHDPLAGVHGTHLGTSLAAAKRAVDAKAGRQGAPVTRRRPFPWFYVVVSIMTAVGLGLVVVDCRAREACTRDGGRVVKAHGRGAWFCLKPGMQVGPEPLEKP